MIVYIRTCNHAQLAQSESRDSQSFSVAQVLAPNMNNPVASCTSGGTRSLKCKWEAKQDAAWIKGRCRMHALSFGPRKNQPKWVFLHLPESVHSHAPDSKLEKVWKSGQWTTVESMYFCFSECCLPRAAGLLLTWVCTVRDKSVPHICTTSS